MRVTAPVRLFRLPALVYFAIFCLYTYPLITQFQTHFFADDRDGLQNVWNLWWFHLAATDLFVSPWYTPLLHHPSGASLIAHTFNPFNGALATPLQSWLSLVESFNVIVIFSFVGSGLTAFWLTLYVTSSYLGSLVAVSCSLSRTTTSRTPKVTCS